jgi:hypothetical protein
VEERKTNAGLDQSTDMVWGTEVVESRDIWSSPSHGLSRCHNVTIEQHVMSSHIVWAESQYIERRLRVKLGIVESAMTFSACANSEKCFVLFSLAPNRRVQKQMKPLWVWA